MTEKGDNESSASSSASSSQAWRHACSVPAVQHGSQNVAAAIHACPSTRKLGDGLPSGQLSASWRAR